MNPLHIVEYVLDTYSYHLAERGGRKALCDPGALMMLTSISILDWGGEAANEGIRNNWCRGCEGAARQMEAKEHKP